MVLLVVRVPPQAAGSVPYPLQQAVRELVRAVVECELRPE
jgi:hypothetical protein